MPWIFNPAAKTIYEQVLVNKADIKALRESGLIMTPRGEWDDSVQYNKNDLISYYGSSFFATVANMGYAPDANPDKWQAVALAGKDGTNGKNGITPLTYASTLNAIGHNEGASATASLSFFSRTPVAGDLFSALFADVADPAGKVYAAGFRISSISESSAIVIINTTAMQLTGPTGATGPEGPGINWKGAWTDGDEVKKDDAYSYGGSSYVANADDVPGPPTEGTNWSLLAEGAHTVKYEILSSATIQSLKNALGLPDECVVEIDSLSPSNLQMRDGTGGVLMDNTTTVRLTIYSSGIFVSYTGVGLLDGGSHVTTGFSVTLNNLFLMVNPTGGRSDVLIRWYAI